MQFAICNEIYQGWTTEDTFAHIARTGYDAVELAPFTLANSVTDLSAAARTALRDTAARHGLAIAGLHWLLVKPEGLGITHPDRAVRERTARYFQELVECCHDLGGQVLVLGSPKQRGIAPGVPRAQAADWAVEVLRDAVKRAEDHALQFCIEPLSPAETNFLNTAAEAIEFARRFDSPNARIILDVKAMSAEARPIPQIIAESWPHFAHFHANDRNLKGPGFGDVDFKPIAAALKGTGYAGFVSVEVFNFEEGADTIATRSLEYLRRAFA